MLGTCSIICQCTSTRSQRRFRSSSQAATYCYYQSNHSKVQAIPWSALPKDTTSELAGLSLHYPFNAERHYLINERIP